MGNATPTVYMISVSETDSLLPMQWQTQVEQQRGIRQTAIEENRQAQRSGFRQDSQPLFLFAQKQNRYSLAIGGYVALRTSYDFDGSPTSIDFRPSDIPVPGNYASRQRLSMDATTSRIYLRSIANTRALGQVIVYVSSDFRGGSQGSYVPRLREAYLSFMGFTFGRDITTFCDLNAAPDMIDAQGPNAYNFVFSTQIRYETALANNRLKVGVAAELPQVSGSYGTTFASIPQRMPDFPMYVEVNWGEQRQSHFRATGIVRNLYLHNSTLDSNTSLLGWGVQASTQIQLAQMVTLYGNGVYGEGISKYIQDLASQGYDFTPDPEETSHAQTMPMWGWYAAARIALLPHRLALAGGYSEAHIERRHGAYSDDEYHSGRFIFGNLFYNLTPRCSVGAEYLYGRRENMDGQKNHANRVSVQIKYNF